MLDGLQDGVLGDFVENDAAGLILGEAQGVVQVPGDGFPFPVLIGGQPDGVGRVCQLLQLVHDLFLPGRNHVFRREPIGYVYAQLLLLQVADVAERGRYCKLLSQKLLDRVHLAR